MSIFRKKHIQLSAFTAAIIGNVLLGTNAVSTKIAIDFDMDPLFYVGLRAILIGLALLLLIKNFDFLRKPKAVGHLFISSALITLFITLAALGLELSSALKASLLSLTTPVSVYILSVLVLREPIIRRALYGGFVALIGALLVVGLPLVTGEVFVFGDLLLFVAYFFLAASIIHAKYIFKWVEPVAVVSIRFLIAGIVIFLGVLAWSGVGIALEPQPQAWLALLYGTVIVGIIGVTMYYTSLSKIKGEEAAPLYYLDPMTGVVMAALLLGDRLEASAVAGAAIVIAGVMIAHPHHGHLLHSYHIHNPHPLQHIGHAWRQLRSKL